MAPSFVLALDQGTSSSRAVLFDGEGTAWASVSYPLAVAYPQPGWVEQDPEEMWSTQLAAARAALARAGVAARELAAVAIANQRETTLLWDRSSGQPLGTAVVWQCRRTAPLCDALRARGLGDEIRRRTGLLLDPYFSGTKVQWLLDQVPGARRRAEAGELCFGTADSWLLWKLTGGRLHATDRTNASRTMLYNLREGRWDPWLLEQLAVPAELLPQVRGSTDLFGETEPGLLGAAIPIAGVAGDQQAALFGQACFRSGMAKNTYGTGSFLLLHTGDKPADAGRDLLTTAAAGPGPRAYALEGSIFVTGAAVQWLCDGLGLIATPEESEALAASVPSSEGVYLVPAFVGLGAPHWDTYARGAIFGLTSATTRAHLVRATLESIAFQTRDVVEAMERAWGRPLAELRVDGGAARNGLLMQMQADLLGRSVVRAAATEATALGAAFLAGLATGLWRDTDEVAGRWRADRTFEPRMSEEEREERYAGWRRAVARAKGWQQPRDTGAPA